MYRQAIAAGERPLVTVVTWIDQWYVQAEWEERFAVSVIINGRGPPEERDAYLKAGFAALAPTA